MRLAIDDFGTGYSSLSYLRQFPFDMLKIDKSFIDDVAAVPNQKELTRAIIELGKTLDLELVAEGIERKDQLTRLQSISTASWARASSSRSRWTRRRSRRCFRR